MLVVLAASAAAVGVLQTDNNLHDTSRTAAVTGTAVYVQQQQRHSGSWIYMLL